MTANLFCPKMGEPRKANSKYVSYCNQNVCHGASTLADMLAICSDPFGGQTVSLAQAQVTTLLYLTKTKSGKTTITGFVGELFSHLAKALNFRPNVILNLTNSRYLPSNKSFTRGKLQEVIIVIFYNDPGYDKPYNYTFKTCRLQLGE